MVFSLIIWSFIGLIPINDQIINENAIRIYVSWGIKYGSAHINRAGASLPRKGVNSLKITEDRHVYIIIMIDISGALIISAIYILRGSKWEFSSHLL